LRIQVLQHVPFEGIGSIQRWADTKGAILSTKPLFEPGALPAPHEFDWLIVMGGPMSVNDESVHSWLQPEKRLIASAIGAGKTVIGICLGAQLIASALGARVFPNAQQEIGWFPVRRLPGVHAEIVRVFPNETEVFHWHGETFELPPGAVGFLESDACRNQAFLIGHRVLGLQFHMETTPRSAALLIDNSREELVPGPHIQAEADMLARPERFARMNRLMDSVLDAMERLSR
jgi:GMP synthase-like glutamine amidotransferase